MANINVGQAASVAFDHMMRILFRPFVFKKWLAFGFVSMLAFGGGGGNFRAPGNLGDTGTQAQPDYAEIMRWLGEYWPLIALGMLIILGIAILFTWLSSVFNFIYVDDITKNSGAIREPFARLKHLGMSYFLWQLAFGLIGLLAMFVLIALPLLWAFVFSGGAGAGAKVISVAWAIIAGLPLFIFLIVAQIFARDFVVPAMYVRNIGVLEGWRVVWPIIRSNAGQMALYVLMLIAISILIGMVAILVVLVGLIPLFIIGGIFFALGYIIWQAAGPSAHVILIVLGSIIGFALLIAWSYAVNCAIQPAMVFRRAFSLVVLGQAEPSLSTLPVTMPTPPPVQGGMP